MTQGVEGVGLGSCQAAATEADKDRPRPRRSGAPGPPPRAESRISTSPRPVPPREPRVHRPRPSDAPRPSRDASGTAEVLGGPGDCFRAEVPAVSLHRNSTPQNFCDGSDYGGDTGVLRTAVVLSGEGLGVGGGCVFEFLRRRMNHSPGLRRRPSLPTPRAPPPLPSKPDLHQRFDGASRNRRDYLPSSRRRVHPRSRPPRSLPSRDTEETETFCPCRDSEQTSSQRTYSLYTLQSRPSLSSRRSDGPDAGGVLQEEDGREVWRNR